MLSFDGAKDTTPRHPQMREYAKIAIPVTAVQQDEPFTVDVSWQDKPLQAQAGDWLVSDENSSWPVAADLFAATYEPTGDGRYIKTATVLAVQIDEPFVVNTLEGQASGQPGDYLAQGPAGEAWPIPREQFESTYVPV